MRLLFTMRTKLFRRAAPAVLAGLLLLLGAAPAAFASSGGETIGVTVPTGATCDTTCTPTTPPSDTGSGDQGGQGNQGNQGAEGSGGGLAFTGADIAAMTALAVLLVGIGTGLTVAGRRRRSHG